MLSIHTFIILSAYRVKACDGPLPAHHRTHHSLSPRCNLESPFDFSMWRKPEKTHGEHINSTYRGLGIKPQAFLLCGQSVFHQPTMPPATKSTNWNRYNKNWPWSISGTIFFSLPATMAKIVTGLSSRCQVHLGDLRAALHKWPFLTFFFLFKNAINHTRERIR